MAEITRVGIPSVLSALTLVGNRLSGSQAGEDIAAGDACYVDSEGRAYRSIGAAVGAQADVRGFAATAASSGEAFTLVFDVVMGYGAGLPRDGELYLSGAIPGGLADAPSPGSTRTIALVVDATRIHVFQS